jgi:hypothetical protein
MNKITTKDRVKYCIGLVLCILCSLFCFIYINTLSAYFGSSITVIWVKTYTIALFEDLCIIQPLKCFMVFLLTVCIRKSANGEAGCQEKFADCLLLVLGGGLSV